MLRGIGHSGAIVVEVEKEMSVMIVMHSCHLLTSPAIMLATKVSE